MASLLKRWGFSVGALPCFYCDADSTNMKIFLFGMIGSLVLATVFAGVGAWLAGAFRSPEDLAQEVFHAEERV